MKWFRVLSFSLLLVPLGLAIGTGAGSAPRQSTTPPPGIREKTPEVFALTNATVVTDPGTVLPGATVVIRDGVIVAAGTGVEPPADARLRDMTGKTIYAGFIDSYSSYGMPKSKPTPPIRSLPVNGSVKRSERGAAYWNPNVTPEYDASRHFKPDSAQATKLRSQGFTTVLTAPRDGIIKGTSAIVFLGDGVPGDQVVLPRAAQHVNFYRARGFRNPAYPNSPMGALTLTRQAFYDADWYGEAQSVWRRNPSLPRPETNDALVVLDEYLNGRGLVMIDTRNELYALRAIQLADEFDLDAILVGSGREYRRLESVLDGGHPIIVPLNFPKAPPVESYEEALNVSLEELLHWDFAPENPGRLVEAGATIALTANGLKDQEKFLERLRLAVERGLDREAALAALTTIPARLFGLEKTLGKIQKGQIANLVVTDGDLFASETKVVETWIEGVRYSVQPRMPVDPRGQWTINTASAGSIPKSFTVTIGGHPGKLDGKTDIPDHDVKIKKVSILGSRLTFQVLPDTLARFGVLLMSGSVMGDEIQGRGLANEELAFGWSARRTKPFEPKEKKAKKPVEMASFPINYPLGAFGRVNPPIAPSVVAFQGATVWTCGPEGNIADATVLTRRGKIVEVGTDVVIPEGAFVVDASGMHLTPGLIDAHSHIASDGGINESGQTITAEVRIGDYINVNDINIYRQLAGGVTSSHIMHGSANVIGGQGQIIKLRWGADPDEMKFKDAPATIKFALGENVKQSNWGDRYVRRFPQTRMGVEQLVRDEFRAALEYKKAWDTYKKNSGQIPPRRDLELDAIVEILDGDRNIHCHSYRQDEILALIRTCDDFDVQLRVLQHILEGYKVADEMAARGIGGSTFSDWWAYKFEVYEAIPYNGALMHDVGVVVSFNSDSAELARRLNTEAAKAIKYGGVGELEAFNFVTANPAEQLLIQNSVGSIAAGKDADIVLWTGPPMSTLSRAEQTWIEGKKYFDRAEDLVLRNEADQMRAVLVQKILRSPNKEKGEKKKAESKPMLDEDACMTGVYFEAEFGTEEVER